MVNSQDSGLTHLDTDLYNRCELPYNPLSYVNKKLKREEVEKRDPSWVNVVIQKPDYDVELAPCKRQGAIGANCYWVNTNVSVDSEHGGMFADVVRCILGHLVRTAKVHEQFHGTAGLLL